MDLDPVFLSRIQFAFLISFHIIFPAFTIGLAAWLATIEGMRLFTGNPIYRRIFDKESNWLPAPNDLIYLAMRLYWPKTEAPSILPSANGTWKPPGIVAAN